MTSFSEDELISQLFAPIAGKGALALCDDVALLPVPPGTELVLTVDTIVADVHFFRIDPPELVARKALRVNLSDLAAKGADPLGFLLSLSLPDNISFNWLQAFSAGLVADAQAFNCPLLGGDTVRTSGPLTISITAIGHVPTGQMVKRTGAKPSDILAVTGTIGNSALGLALRLEKMEDVDKEKSHHWCHKLTGDEQAFLLHQYLLPEPRNTISRIIREYASGAMDVSDGLIGDARKMLRVSGVSGHIDLEKIPLSRPVKTAIDFVPELLVKAITGGDDYEVLCSVPADQFNRFQQKCNLENVALTAIGYVVAGDEPLATSLNGVDYPIESGSYSHF